MLLGLGPMKNNPIIKYTDILKAKEDRDLNQEKKKVLANNKNLMKN